MDISYHFWDISQVEDVDQIVLLVEDWVIVKREALPQLEQYHLNPYRVMALTDQALDFLEKSCSVENLPSPIKKAACLCHFTAKERPLRHNSPDSGYAELEERIINAKMGLDFAFVYLLHSVFTGAAKATVEPKDLPRFPSRHFMVDIVQRLAADELPVGGLCLILELLLYAANRHIAGIIDPCMEEKLKKMVEGYDLVPLYNGLSAMK